MNAMRLNLALRYHQKNKTLQPILAAGFFVTVNGAIL
jgi:hypothetical protein